METTITTITADAGTLARVLTAAALHASPDAHKYHLRTVRLEMTGDTITATATDGYSLAVITMPAEIENAGSPIHLAAPDVANLAKALKARARITTATAPVLQITGETWQHSSPDGSISGRLVECEYPPVRQIIDSNPHGTFTGPVAQSPAFLARIGKTASTLDKNAAIVTQALQARKPAVYTVNAGPVSATLILMPQRMN